MKRLLIAEVDPNKRRTCPYMVEKLSHSGTKDISKLEELCRYGPGVVAVSLCSDENCPLPKVDPNCEGDK